MKKAILERNIVVVLFVLVLVIFSFAEKDSKKLDSLYNKKTGVKKLLKKNNSLAATETEKKALSTALPQN